MLASPRARLRMHLRPYSSCAENFIREPVSVESPKLENLKARNYYKIVAVSMGIKKILSPILAPMN